MRGTIQDIILALCYILTRKNIDSDTKGTGKRWYYFRTYFPEQPKVTHITQYPQDKFTLTLFQMVQSTRWYFAKFGQQSSVVLLTMHSVSICSIHESVKGSFCVEVCWWHTKGTRNFPVTFYCYVVKKAYGAFSLNFFSLNHNTLDPLLLLKKNPDCHESG